MAIGVDKELGTVQSNTPRGIVSTVEAGSGVVEMGQWERQHSAKTLTCWKGNAGLESQHTKVVGTICPLQLGSRTV